MMATAMSTRPTLPSTACSTAVATRSWGAFAMLLSGSTLK